MFRRSTNNPWIPVGGLNFGYVDGIGGSDPSPGAGQRFNGQLGQTVVHSNKSALQDSAKIGGTTFTLFEGVYQLVKFSNTLVGTTGSPTLVKRGSIVFWNTNALNGIPNFEVTDSPTATNSFRAGVVVCPDTLLAGVAGKFGYIQVAGLATGLYQAAVTSAVLGNLVTQGSLTTNVFNAVADAGTDFATNVGEKLMAGLAYELPANNGLLKILMSLRGWVPNVG